MHKMATAFNTTVAALEDELTQLILEGLINARIDSHSKVSASEPQVVDWTAVLRLKNSLFLGYFEIASICCEWCFKEGCSAASMTLQLYSTVQEGLSAMEPCCSSCMQCLSWLQILYARDVDQRSTTFEKSLLMGKEFQRRAKAMILRAAVLRNQIHVKVWPWCLGSGQWHSQ